MKNKSVLELACGGAQCGIAMAKKGANVTGIDISQEQLKHAKNLADENNVKINLVQGSFQNLDKIRSDSKDIVFTAFGLQYSPDIKKVFKQVYRILNKRGIFVFSLDHPFFRLINLKTFKLQESYFKTGRWNEKGSKLILYAIKISDIFNYLVESGFIVEKIIEPDSRIRYKNDSFYGIWDYNPKILNLIPPTIIFKARKIL